MGYADPFLLGPVGRMAAMPSPVAAGFPAQYQRIAAEHRSIRGGTTIDLLGVVREWAFALDYKSDADAARLVTRWTSPLLTEQLRLLDPMTPNRLSLDLASGCGVTGQPGDNLASSDPGTTVIAPNTRPAVLDGLLDRALRWSPTAVVTELYLGTDDRVPVTVGESITFRCWARSSGAAVSVLPFIRAYDAANAYTDTVGGYVPLTSTWAELPVTAVMGAGRVTAIAGLHVDAGASGRVVDITGLQMGATDALPGAGQWTPGGGAPAVVFVGFDHSYGRLGRHAMTPIFREA